MKEKFTREEALLQEYDAEIKKLVETKNDEGAAAKRKELMSKMSTAQHDAEFEIRKAKYDTELQEALQRQDFRTAAVLQQEFDSMMSAAPVPSSQAPVCGTTLLAMEKHRKHQGISLRLPIYAAILRRNYGIVLKSMHLVQLHENQHSYRFIPIPAFLDVAQEMLQVTQPVG